MNEDYLWDKTGEPDAEIVQLERILGTLRYQPRAFEVPKESRTENKRGWLSLLAIAATIAIAVVAAGLWLSLSRTPRAEIAAIQLPPEPRPIVVNQDFGTKSSVKLVRYPNPVVHRRQPAEQMLAERKEAEEAKQQLLLALRVTSSKLSMAQKKVQGTPTGIIRNQHKLG